MSFGFCFMRAGLKNFKFEINYIQDRNNYFGVCNTFGVAWYQGALHNTTVMHAYYKYVEK